MRVFLILIFISTLSACSSWWREDKDRANLFMQMGVSQMENEDYPNALSSFLQAEKFDAKNPVIQNNIGLVYFFRERFELAEQHLAKAISLEPKFTEARNNYARVLIEEGKYAAAEKELKIVLSDLTFTGFAKAYNNYGLSKFNQKQYTAALTQFSKSIELDHENCAANNYYGRSLFELNDYERAASALDRAISFCQKLLFDEPHYYSAVAYYRLGQKSKSIARFEEIVKLYSNGKYRDKSKAMLELIRKGGS